MHNKSENDEKGHSVEDIWAGCDVAKETFDVSLATSRDLKSFPVGSFRRSPDGVQDFLKWADSKLASRKCCLRIVMESTGKYSLALAAWMIAARPSLAPAIVNPYMVKSFFESMGLRNKTDAIDARGLACFGQQRQPKAYEPASKPYRDLQTLVRLRRAMINDRTANELRLKEMDSDAPGCKILKKAIKHQEKAEAECVAAMEKLVKENPDLSQDIELVCKIDGVGFIVAATVLGELGDLRRFEDAKQIASFSGLSPRRYESGTSVHRKTTLSKKGNGSVRAILYLAALSVIRGKNDLAKMYNRLIAAGHSGKSALCAVARKLLVLMRTIIISGENYEPFYVKKFAQAS